MLRTVGLSSWFSSFLWFYSGLPGCLLFAVLCFSFALPFFNPETSFKITCWLQPLYWFFWFSLGFVSLKRTLRAWSAQEEPLLERSWTRAFQEVSQPIPRSPRFFVSTEMAPIFLGWCSASGQSVLILSRSWLESRTEVQIRESFRDAAPSLDSGSLRWKVAKAWFFWLQLRWLPEAVMGALGGVHSREKSSTVFSWAIALPWVSWLLWVSRSAPGRWAPLEAPHHSAHPTDLLPHSLERRAATLITSIHPCVSEKSILSSALQS